MSESENKYLELIIHSFTHIPLTESIVVSMYFFNGMNQPSMDSYKPVNGEIFNN